MGEVEWIEETRSVNAAYVYMYVNMLTFDLLLDVCRIHSLATVRHKTLSTAGELRGITASKTSGTQVTHKSSAISPVLSLSPTRSFSAEPN
jgi:hypothetical protein